jgi:hypothetical protein
MTEPHAGQHVLTEHGSGIVDTITAGHAGADIFRYRIISGTRCRWHYLDEIIVIAEPAQIGPP